MAGINQTLIDAIRRIAKTDPEISSALGALRKRGVIDGISSTLGGDDGTGSEEDCCTDAEPKEIPEDDLPPIDGDAPKELPATPEGWTDCATGGQVQFTPGGFPQAESCKECEPDPDWEKGYAWFAESLGIFAASPGTMCASLPTELENVGCVSCTPYTRTGCGRTGAGSVRADYVSYLPDGGVWGTTSIGAVKIVCGASTADYCTIEEAPEICGDDWEPDGKTDLTLAGGCIVASKCDTEADISKLGCNKCIFICNAEGQKRQICALEDGGFIMTDPNGEFKGGRYDSRGQRMETFAPGETGGYI